MIRMWSLIKRVWLLRFHRESKYSHYACLVWEAR